MKNIFLAIALIFCSLFSAQAEESKGDKIACARIGTEMVLLVNPDKPYGIILPFKAIHLWLWNKNGLKLQTDPNQNGFNPFDYSKEELAASGLEANSLQEFAQKCNLQATN